MKINLYSLIFLGLTLFATTSCEKWMDVDPKTDVKADDFFDSENGYYASLQGIYTSMAAASTYGNNLSFGMLDQLALVYDSRPAGSITKEEVFEYEISLEGYDTKARLAATWSATYNLIANANNLLRWIDEKGTAVLDPNTVNLFKGELYGLRAFFHFDLLRLWGPMGYDAANTTKYIPYRFVADNTKQPLLTQQAVTANILSDLSLAEQLLAQEKTEKLTNNAPTSDRCFRFNYYAVKALQARVYNYCGMKAEAFAAAKEVVDNSGLALQTENSTQPAMYKEIVFGIYKYRMSEEIISYFDEGPIFNTQYTTDAGTMEKLFRGFTGTSSDVDIRMKNTAVLGYDFTRDGKQTRTYISRKYIKNDEEIIPLVRLPEMYYIMCESADLSVAPEYVNAVKSKRGYTKSSMKSVFRDETDSLVDRSLVFRILYYSEGHYFYFLKRNKIKSVDYYPYHSERGVVSETPFYFDEKKYVVPLPDNEKEYGWTEENKA